MPQSLKKRDDNLPANNQHNVRALGKAREDAQLVLSLVFRQTFHVFAAGAMVVKQVEEYLIFGFFLLV